MRPSRMEAHVKQLPVVLVAGLTILPSASAAISAVQAPPVNPDAQLLLEFKERVDTYIQLRNKADDGAPPLEKTEDVAKIRQAQFALVERIKAARPGAKQGDIFTPAIASHFKRLARPPAKETGSKAILKEDNPGPVAFKVNERYPDKEPLATVPPALLDHLPKLPDKQDLEYRFVGKHLVLIDTRAHFVVDYVPNAIS
jgi:hypothetical protein